MQVDVTSSVLLPCDLGETGAMFGVEAAADA